jgi:hypothetical protein
MGNKSVVVVCSFLLVFSQLGCATVRITEFSSEVRTPKTGNIDVFFTTASIKLPYKEVALITVDDEGWGLDETKLLELLIKKTKEVGADGVIVLAQDKKTGGYLPIGAGILAITETTVRGSAIVYLKKEPEQQQTIPKQTIPKLDIDLDSITLLDVESLSTESGLQKLLQYVEKMRNNVSILASESEKPRMLNQYIQTWNRYYLAMAMATNATQKENHDLLRMANERLEKNREELMDLGGQMASNNTIPSKIYAMQKSILLTQKKILSKR